MGSQSGDHVGDVRSVVVRHMPDYRVDSVVRLGEGLDNIAYKVNGELIVRVSKEPDPTSRAACIRHETRLLTAVAGFSPLPVPEPIFMDPNQGCLAYRKVPGLPLLDIPQPHQSAHGRSIATTLSELLTALHAVPVDRMAELADTDNQPLAEWRRQAAVTSAEVAQEIPVVHRRPIAEFLDAPPPDDGYALVFSHNDLGIEHVLVDPIALTVTGIIDWSEAGIVDPAYDFGLIYRDLGPAALDVALHSYRTDIVDVGSIARRAAFYARCSVFEDLAYGVEAGDDKFVTKSLAGLEWLFPA